MRDRLNSALAGPCCTGVLCLGLFFGIFFGLNYPEIRINTVYKPAQCLVTAEYIQPYTCCRKSCFGCFHCGFGDPSCSYALLHGIPGTCCDGYECCSRCCSTCSSCSGSGKSRHCHSYSCNCHCCDFTSNQACSVSCRTCYNAFVDVTYGDTDGDQHQATLEEKCGTSESCADTFVGSHKTNHTYGCWYDPDNYGAVVFHRGYSAWKWALFAFPAFSLLALMWFCSFACFASCFKRKAPAAAATLLLWMGFLLPFAFFLPLYEFGRLPSPSGREVLMGFIVAFPSIACCAAGVIMFRDSPPSWSSSTRRPQPTTLTPAVAPGNVYRPPAVATGYGSDAPLLMPLGSAVEAQPRKPLPSPSAPPADVVAEPYPSYGVPTASGAGAWSPTPGGGRNFSTGYGTGSDGLDGKAPQVQEPGFSGVDGKYRY